MIKFLELEGGYLVIGLFIVAVAIFVWTRPFVAGGKKWKQAVIFVLFGIAGFILAHYFVTINRMADVKTWFENGKPVICENRAIRKVAQSIIIDPTSKQKWSLQGDIFVSPLYSRPFHTARCLEYIDNK
ncbi:MAG: hypothetical protein DRG11_05535 [Epsilonproteobacteria bacterium]|nr:MAG: hypothetical protein DRG11_05535 [Campylobacterota bacterium]